MKEKKKFRKQNNKTTNFVKSQDVTCSCSCLSSHVQNQKSNNPSRSLNNKNYPPQVAKTKSHFGPNSLYSRSLKPKEIVAKPSTF